MLIPLHPRHLTQISSMDSRKLLFPLIWPLAFLSFTFGFVRTFLFHSYLFSIPKDPGSVIIIFQLAVTTCTWSSTSILGEFQIYSNITLLQCYLLQRHCYYTSCYSLVIRITNISTYVHIVWWFNFADFVKYC